MNIVKSYFAHLIAYVGAAYVVVTKVDPAILPPNVAAAISTWGPIVGATLAAVHHVTSAPSGTTPPPPPVTSVVKLHVLTMLAAIVIACTVFAGCASVQSWISSPTGQTVTAAGVQVAVTTAEQKGVSAVQINGVAKAVLANDQGLATSVVGLTTVVNAQLVKLNIPAGDVAAFQGLEIAFDAYLVAKYGNDSTITNLQSDVATFCNLVIADTGG